MAKNGDKIEQNGNAQTELLQQAAKLQRTGNRAVRKAQTENRKSGIPNWYSIGGKIICDCEMPHQESENH